MTEDLTQAHDSLCQTIAHLKAASLRVINTDDQFAEIVMRGLLKQSQDLKARLREVMAAAGCPIVFGVA